MVGNFPIQHAQGNSNVSLNNCTQWLPHSGPVYGGCSWGYGPDLMTFQVVVE